MTVSNIVAQHLPYLRRFARALSGSQASGDAYVASFLEILVSDPSGFPVDLEPRVAVYQTFLKLWNSVGFNLAPEGHMEPADGTVDEKLMSITPIPRQAFLLCSVEGFDMDEVAQILDASVDEVRNLVDEAGREIARQVSTAVLIIEDEPMIALDLENIIESLGHSVTSIERTYKDAVRAASEKPPGLVLADIQLADGSSGIDAVNEVLKSYEVPVIFITAYPERLLTGERPEPTFLVPKPYQQEDVKAIVSHALFFEEKAHALRRGAKRAN